MATPKVRVLRDSKISEIDGRELVPGDLIHLEAGNQLAADARLIEAVQLQRGGRCDAASTFSAQ